MASAAASGADARSAAVQGAVERLGPEADLVAAGRAGVAGSLPKTRPSVPIASLKSNQSLWQGKRRSAPQRRQAAG